jgi:hypothetical protein
MEQEKSSRRISPPAGEQCRRGKEPNKELTWGKYEAKSPDQEMRRIPTIMMNGTKIGAAKARTCSIGSISKEELR